MTIAEFQQHAIGEQHRFDVPVFSHDANAFGALVVDLLRRQGVPIPKPHNCHAADNPIQDRKKVAHALLDRRRRADRDEAGLRKLPREDPVVAGLVKRWMIIVLRRTLAEDKAVWSQKVPPCRPRLRHSAATRNCDPDPLVRWSAVHRSSEAHRRDGSPCP